MINKPNSTITIEGTVFEVDIETQRLVEQGNPANAISFIDQMTDHGTHYSMYYDLNRKNQCDTSIGSYESEDWEGIKIPKLIDLDPVGMAEQYGCTVDQLKGKTDFEVIVDQDTFSKRQLGALPQIDIAGEKFFVDLRLEELRHVNNHFPVLRLKDFDMDSNGDHYLAYYHPATRQIVELDPRLTEFPEGIIKISLPGDVILDPVGIARQYEISERDLLRRYPIQKNLKAEVIPLSETTIPAMIRRNREQLQQEHERNAKRLKPKRPRF